MAIIEAPSSQPKHRLQGGEKAAKINNSLMNETSFPTPVGSNAATMSVAYRAATDDDARTVLAEIENPSTEGPSKIDYYMIPRDWLDSFLAYINSASAERPEKIENTKLLMLSDVKPQVSFSLLERDTKARSGEEGSNRKTDDMNDDESDDVDAEEHERRRLMRRQQWQEREQRLQQQLRVDEQTKKLKPDLVHDHDYALVGHNSWTVLSSKFGYDVQIPLECVTIENGDDVGLSTASAAAGGRIAVGVYPLSSGTDSLSGGSTVAASIPIPLSGKFEYSQREASESSRQPQSEGDVASEDEGAGVNDLFPAANHSPMSDDVAESNSPVLLLPPSTTTTTSSTGRQLALVSLDSNNSCSNSNSLYPNTNDLECDGDKNIDECGSGYPCKKQKRYGSGLGNLGNTCFMNSTLQCLAHTDPLRQYFASGEFRKDLNRDNPLGTGGELATEFADLLNEMWGTGSKQSSRNMYGSPYDSPIVYPRNFKYTLGRHAEQFMGYDQHDSQELATYLLDALHEDTNRVTKKPYVEKPEQGEDEDDDFAADKAWNLHLRREDSRVLENFMGQVKSRVNCPTPGCGRVSTTFDPFMYLSVPIPGATDRTLTVTFVPLNFPSEGKKKMHVTLNKTSTVSALQLKVTEMLNERLGNGSQVKPVDLCMCDIWSGDVYSFYKPSDEIERIRDTDTTYAFQLCPASTFHSPENDNDEVEMETMRTKRLPKVSKVKLDMATLTRLNREDGWMKRLGRFVKQPTMLYKTLNAKRGTFEERKKFEQKMENFILLCSKCPDSVEKSRGVSDADFEETGTDEEDPVGSRGDRPTGDDVSEEEAPTLAERSETSSTFKNVRNTHDLAVFEFCYGKVRQYTETLEKEKKEQLKDGIVVSIVFKRRSLPTSIGSIHHRHSSSGPERTFAPPLALRLSPRLSVFGLRELLSERLSGAIRIDPRKGLPTTASDRPSENENELEATEPSGVAWSPGLSSSTTAQSNGDGGAKCFPRSSDIESGKGDTPESLIMRQVPMTYERKNAHSYSTISTNHLGSIQKPEMEEHSMGQRVSLAAPDDEDEQKLVSEVVGTLGTVYLNFSTEFLGRCVDEEKLERVEDFATPEIEEGGGPNKKTLATTVLDCISKYCQMEQLEESDMWYCNKCKDHVRAWKQCHIYRAPPILIVHLKRFQYSSTTHRRDKIDTFIDFPLDGLELTKEVMHWEEGETPIYDCYAVSNHYGGLGGGHYTAYARNDDGAWCHFDDSRVTTGVAENEVVSSAAYVLYYRRMDVQKVGEEKSRIFTRSCETEGVRLPSGSIGKRTEEMDVEYPCNDGFSSRASSRTLSSPMNSANSINDDDMYDDGSVSEGGKGSILVTGIEDKLELQ